MGANILFKILDFFIDITLFIWDMVQRLVFFLFLGYELLISK